MNKLFAVAALILALGAIPVAGQSGFSGETKTIRIGGNATLNATVVNPLSIQDTMEVTFSGDAIDSGLVFPFYTRPGDVDCDALNNVCEVPMDAGPNERQDIRIILNGTAIGQETLKATVRSKNTNLSSSDRIEIHVKPYFGRSTVSAPGIQGIHIVVIALLGALVSTVLSRRRD